MTRFASMLRTLALVSLLTAACGVPTFILQQYDGPPRAAESVAVVRFDGKGTVDLVSIDGSIADAHVPDDARLHVEVLPGRHVLGVAHRTAQNEPPRRVVFVAEAARYYEVAFMPPPASEWQPSVHVFEIDKRSGAKLRDVTYTAPRRTAAPPPVAAPPSVAAPPQVPAPLDTSTSPAAPSPSSGSGAAGAPND